MRLAREAQAWRWVATIVLGALLHSGAVEAEAQPIDDAPSTSRGGEEPAGLDEARRLFRAGIELARRERWGEALAAFRQSRAAHERPSTVFNIASTLARLGRGQEALIAIDDFLRISDPEGDAEQRAQASELRRTVESSLSVLELRTDPEAVEITVDGRPVESEPGENGDRVVLDPGDHTVEVQAAGYLPHRFTIASIAGDHHSRSVQLTPLPAQLTVRASAGDARIWVDGILVSEGSHSGAARPGAHRIRVEAPGHRPFEARVVVSTGEHRELAASLTPIDERPLRRSPLLFGGVAAVVAGVAITLGVVLPVTDVEDAYGGSTGVVLMGLAVRR